MSVFSRIAAVPRVRAATRFRPGQYVVRLERARVAVRNGYVLHVRCVVVEADDPGRVGDEVEWVCRLGRFDAQVSAGFAAVERFASSARESRAASGRPSDPGMDPLDVLDAECGGAGLLRGVYLRASATEAVKVDGRLVTRVTWSVPSDLARILYENVEGAAGRAWLREVLPSETRKYVWPGNELVLWDRVCESGILDLAMEATG